MYGGPNTFGLFPGRVTSIIDQEGVPRHVLSFPDQRGEARDRSTVYVLSAPKSK